MVVCVSDSYQIARRRALRAEETSNLESQEEEEDRHSRQRRAKRVWTDSDESEIEQRPFIPSPPPVRVRGELFSAQSTAPCSWIHMSFMPTRTIFTFSRMFSFSKNVEAPIKCTLQTLAIFARRVFRFQSFRS